MRAENSNKKKEVFNAGKPAVVGAFPHYSMACLSFSFHLCMSVYALTIIQAFFFLFPRVLERSFFCYSHHSLISSDLAANEFLNFQVTYTYLSVYFNQ